MVFLLNYLTDTLERAQEAATRNVTQEKLFLEILQNLQEKTCARASFLIRLQPKTCNFIRPATVLKKKLWRSCFSCEFCEISKNNFFTEQLWAAVFGIPIILCSFMETFIDVFIYCFPVKEKQ